MEGNLPRLPLPKYKMYFIFGQGELRNTPIIIILTLQEKKGVYIRGGIDRGAQGKARSAIGLSMMR